MFAGQESRTVVLPEGKWYDFYTGELAGDNETIEVNPGLEKIPLFVKDGGIIPMVPAMRHAPGPDAKLPLEIRHYGNSTGSFDLYDDDGRSFNFEKGEYSVYQPFRVEKDKKGALTGKMAKPEAGKPFGYDDKVTWKFMTGMKK
jgi:alpha-glucosidase (family GH31 glycosyl hydrolase)